MSVKVMIVDDSSTIRLMVSKILSDAGFEVIQAANGQEGLDGLARGPQVVFCDVNMPKMSGIEFLESAKRDETKPKVPIVMMTTECERELISRAKALGAAGWVVKPVKPDQIIAAVKRLSAMSRPA